MNKILSKLPQYSSLPPLANFADTVARTYKTFGKKEALGEIKKKPDTPKGKSIAYAFLLVFDKGKDTKWQYSKQEIEYGEFLKEYAKNLLDAERMFVTLMGEEVKPRREFIETHALEVENLDI